MLTESQIYPSARCLLCGKTTRRKASTLPTTCSCGGEIIRCECKERVGRRGYYRYRLLFGRAETDITSPAA